MKKIIRRSILPLLILGGIAGWYFGSRWYYTGQADWIALSLEGVVKYCHQAIAEKKTYLDAGNSERDVQFNRRRYEELKPWAVSQRAKDRVAAAESAAQKAVDDLRHFIDQSHRQKIEAEQKAKQLADAEWKTKRDAAEKQEAEKTQQAAAERKKISDSVTATRRPAGSIAPAGWPLSDPWPNDLKTAKVLIWDQTKNDVHPAQEKLPDAIKGKVTDGQLLICAVMQEHLQPVVEYKQDAFRKKYHWESDATISGKIVGHRKWLAVRLVRYPDKEWIGAYTIVGDEPGDEVFVATKKEDRKAIVGEYEFELSKWIQRRLGSTSPVERFLAAQNPAEAMNLAEEIAKDLNVIGPSALPYLAQKLKQATDPDMQYAVIRVIQAAKRENPNYVAPIIQPGEDRPAPRAPNIGPSSYEAFKANPRRWLLAINEWLKVQAPGG